MYCEEYVTGAVVTAAKKKTVEDFGQKGKTKKPKTKIEIGLNDLVFFFFIFFFFVPSLFIVCYVACLGIQCKKPLIFYSTAGVFCFCSLSA